MANINFKRIDGHLNIEMAVGIVGYIRCMKDANVIPGAVEWSCAIEIQADGRYEFKILSGLRGPSVKEVKVLIRYFKSLGYSGGWRRFKEGKPPKQVIA